MPDRNEVIHSVEDYMKTREESRKPQTSGSALAVGILNTILGAVMMIVGWPLIGESGYLFIIGTVSFVMGIAFVVLARKGTAQYRVTETTRYPQQTGEIHDLFFQILGEKYLWFVVAWMVVVLVLMVLTIG